uniref:Piezo_RRas_bdg domain-containing protein n=1 Tax=Heligmosomoides polygyrus TaxID=6339 RepID=A0A183FVK1_HELPZ
LIWRLTEVHIAKIVFIVVAVFIAQNVSFFIYPFVYSFKFSAVFLTCREVLCFYLFYKFIYRNLSEFQGMVVAIIALALQSVVVYRQRLYRRRHGLPEGRVFPSLQPDEFDRSVPNALMFLVDFGFYKFGFEISVIMMAINAWIRMDGLGAVMCIWIGVFALSKRQVCRKVWYIFVIYLAILLPTQYIIYVGLPEDSCLAYPWDHIFGEPSRMTKNVNFDIWFGLSNYAVLWPAENLIADFFLLLIASCQLTVFRCEGTDNDSIFTNDDYDLKPNNPRYDFLATQRSFVDFVKIGVFHYGHWVTLITVLIAGIGGTSLFALGYIMITFWILWQGNNLYVMNPHTNSFKSTLAKWKTLITYTVFTMFCKVALQLVGCVYMEWFFDGAGCKPMVVAETELDRMCPVIPQEAQIGFDAVALAFLIFQLRVFHSWFFQHCMVEYRSEIILANRGAVLKNQLIEKEMKEQNEQQAAKFDEIRRRTQAIRERYNKQMEKGDIMFEPQTYANAKRAGDYYMFDYDPSTDDLVKPVESFVPEVTPGATSFEKLDPGQLLYAATGHDLNLAQTLQQVKGAEKLKENEERMLEALQKDQPVYSKVVTLLKFMQKIATNAMDMLSALLNRLSREHRYVAYVLHKEKEKLKEGHSESLSDTSRRLTDVRQGMNMTNLLLVQNEMESEALSDWQQRSVIARLTNALGSCIAANTDFICYLLAVLSHATHVLPGVITLPLPLMVFFWGTLSNPRPSKFFWVAMIAYTEFVIVTKFVCQFTIFDFNSVWSEQGLFQVLGVQRQSNFAAFDVPLLFALFFHRYMLRKLGLWKVSIEPQQCAIGAPSKEKSAKVPSQQQDQHEGAESGSSSRPSTPSEAERDAATNPIVRFIMQLFKPKFRYIRDLYPIMFGLDVLAFLIIAFGYSAFGQGSSGNVIGDIQASRIPLTFVVMLIVMTLMIVVDRGLYLRKWVHGKLAYQLMMILFLHIWIFFILPYLTRRAAMENPVAQALYVVKCLYLLVSAWQIRNGYPQLCAGNLLTHAYGLANMVFFKIFMLVPFLFELRTAIDWTWTDTSMPLFDFFNMENFYAVIYNLKCARTFEQSYPAPRGVPKGAIIKYLMGLPLILVIIIIVWFPLLAFSLLNRIGNSFQPLYEIEAQGSELRAMRPDELQYLTDTMRFDERTDVKSSINFIVAIEFTRPYDEKKKVATSHSSHWSTEIKANSTLRSEWVQMLENPSAVQTVSFYNQDNYQRPKNASDRDWFDTVQMSVWIAQARHPPQYTNVYFNASTIPYGTHRDRTYVQTIAFVDKALPSFFAQYLQGGVIAMYVSIVIVVGRLIRTLFTHSPTDVMVTEIPNPDFLLKICLDIYLVREAKDFFLEQDLFAKLIFLFRSPATLIQWTRMKHKRE